jgi:hypothetical protein
MFFYDGLNINVDLESSNEVDKCSHEIELYRGFVNLGTFLHNLWRRVFLKNFLNSHLESCLHYWRCSLLREHILYSKVYDAHVHILNLERSSQIKSNSSTAFMKTPSHTVEGRWEFFLKLLLLLDTDEGPKFKICICCLFTYGNR